GRGFELIVEIIDDLRERHFIDKNGPRRAQIFGANVDAAPLSGKLHQIADIFRRHDEAGADKGLTELFDLTHIRHFLRVVNENCFAVACQDFISDVWRGRYQLQFAVALEALLDDFAMEHAQKAAAKAEAQSFAAFRLVRKAGIVEAQ